MTSIKNKINSLELSDKYLPVQIDGSSSVGDEIVYTTSLLTLKNMLYVPKFQINQLNKNDNCSMTFFLSYCIFQYLRTRIKIGTCREKGRMYYLDEGFTPTGFVVGTSNTLLQRQYLHHPSLSSLRKVCPSYSPSPN